MWLNRIQDWGATVAIAAILAVLAMAAAMYAGPLISDVELRKALYGGASGVFFAGLIGGVLKLLLDDIAMRKRIREDAATFVTNVLADLKSVYDRVAQARILIPAHQSVQTYAEEMRSIIGARVQLRNVKRALERRPDSTMATTQRDVMQLVRRMDAYLETLTDEFRDNFRSLSDRQRAFQARADSLLKRFGEASEGMPPELPGLVWNSMAGLPHLADFMGPAKDYESRFERPLDDASELLRKELARIIGRR